VWILETEVGKPNARAMLLCSLAFSFPALEHLWSQTQAIAATLDLLQDSNALAWSWAGACGGWLLGETVWIVSKLASEMIGYRQISALKAERSTLEAEWGTSGLAPGLSATARVLPR